MTIQQVWDNFSKNKFFCTYNADNGEFKIESARIKAYAKVKGDKIYPFASIYYYGENQLKLSFI